LQMTTKEPTGRPTKLTPKLQSKFVDLIAKGHYISTACQACGIARETFYTWLERAEQEAKNGGGIYADFHDAVKKAEAEAEEALLAVVREKAIDKKDWLPAMTILERRHPEKWGRRDRSTITLEETKEITITHVTVVKDYGEGYINQAKRREVIDIKGEDVKELPPSEAKEG